MPDHKSKIRLHKNQLCHFQIRDWFWCTKYRHCIRLWCTASIRT